jgi:hypothetical protein
MVCKKNIFVYIFLCLLVSCKTSQDPIETPLFIRTSIESSTTSDARIRVFVEGKDGNMLTGAVVLVRNSQNNVLVLPLDSLFYFSVQSAVSPERKEYSIRHQKLSTSAALQEMKDSEGNSSLLGEKLQANKPVQIVWNSVVPNALYQIRISDAFGLVYAVSTQETQCIIPENTFIAGNYFVEIITQIIFGDPLFISDTYSREPCKAIWAWEYHQHTRTYKNEYFEYWYRATRILCCESAKPQTVWQG